VGIVPDGGGRHIRGRSFVRGGVLGMGGTIFLESNQKKSDLLMGQFPERGGAFRKSKNRKKVFFIENIAVGKDRVAGRKVRIENYIWIQRSGKS